MLLYSATVAQVEKTDKAAKLIALLEELPFVEIQPRQHLPPPVSPLELFERYLTHQHLGWDIQVQSPFKVGVFNGITHFLTQNFTPQQLNTLYLQLAQDPGLFEAQSIQSGEHKAYCLYRNGLRVLYQLNQDSSLYIFHIATAPSATTS